MPGPPPMPPLFPLLLLLRVVAASISLAETDPGHAAAMHALSTSLSAEKSLGWSSSTDPCSWHFVTCNDGRITAIQIGNQSLSGTLPSSSSLANLTSLSRLELQQNHISGPLPSLKGLSLLQVLLIHGNLFTSMPPDFFSCLSSLQAVTIDNNPFYPWQLPARLKDTTTLVSFSANAVNLIGGSAICKISSSGITG